MADVLLTVDESNIFIRKTESANITVRAVGWLGASDGDGGGGGSVSFGVSTDIGNIATLGSDGLIYVPSSGGGGGVTIHADLQGRDQPGQHPQSAIIGLTDALNARALSTHNHDVNYPTLVTYNNHLSDTDAHTAAGYIKDAPLTGGPYARQSGTWTVVTGGTGGGIEDALADGNIWARQNAVWVKVDDTFLKPSEILAGSSIAVDRSTTPGSAIISVQSNVFATSTQGQKADTSIQQDSTFTSAVQKVIVLTQAQYDGIGTKDPTALYLIT